MKLEKAVEILELLDHADNWVIDSDDIDAIKLGEEALKYVLASRGIGAHYAPTQLIGETPAGDPP